MKILFLTASFYPSIGGVETHVLEVSKELVKIGHKVTLVTEFNGSKSKVNGVKIIRIKLKQGRYIKLFNIYLQLFRNRELFKNADIIHCHDVFIWYLPFRFLFFRKKVFTTFHGYEGRFPPEEKSILLRRISEKLSGGNICVGDFITRWYKTKPDYLTYGGVKNGKVLKINKPRKRKIKILLIGRLEKDIGVNVYLDSLRKMKNNGIKFELEVLGEGGMRKHLKKIGKVFGFVKNTESYIKKADIVFASSYLTMLSIMKIGKPVFAVYTNPLKHDYLYSSPFSKFIYIFSSSKELVRSIKNYKPNIQRLTAAQRWANSQTWEKIANIYLDLWSKK